MPVPGKVATMSSTIMGATCPEDLFGPLLGTKDDQLESVRRRYREMARLAHPDFADPEDKASAEDAFTQLPKIRDAAEQAIKAGAYGQRKPFTPAATPVVIRSRSRAYAVGDPFTSGDLANLYHCTVDSGSAPSGGTEASTSPSLLKVARNAADNDLIRAEATTLRHLLSPDKPESKGFFPLLPRLTDSFSFRDSGGGPARQASVFGLLPDFYSLEDVRKAYPGGISSRHMAWIWRQLLLVLGYAHARNVIHGAVLPSHVLIHPDHDLLLVDWCYSVRDKGARIPAISERYADWYPPEVLAKQAPSPATDVYMSARCMEYLMGAGDGGYSASPRLRGFIASCLLKPVSYRPQDAWKLRKDFTALIEQIWGPRKRIVLDMPSSK